KRSWLIGARFAITCVDPCYAELSLSGARDNVRRAAQSLPRPAVPDRKKHIRVVQHVFAGRFVGLVASGRGRHSLYPGRSLEKDRELGSRLVRREVADVIGLVERQWNHERSVRPRENVPGCYAIRSFGERGNDRQGFAGKQVLDANERFFNTQFNLVEFGKYAMSGDSYSDQAFSADS